MEKCFIDQKELGKAFEMIVKGGTGPTAFEKLKQIRGVFGEKVELDVIAKYI